MSDPIEARVGSLQASIDANTAAIQRTSDELAQWRADAPKLVSSIGEEARTTADHFGDVAMKKGGGSLAVWLLIVVAYKLLSKWLGI